MGSSVSKLDKEEAVKQCKNRQKLIKQAIKRRTHFATHHIAYLNSLKRVSNALRSYVEGDKPREFLLEDHFSTPVKKPDSGFISVSPEFSPINYMRHTHGDPSVIIEEMPPQNIRVEVYSPHHHFGSDGSLPMQWSPMNSSSYKPSYSPPSSENSRWDFFMNPFSSFDNYDDQNGISIDQGVLNDDITTLRRVREQEGIPELEEETEQEEFDENVNVLKKRVFNNSNKKYTSGNHDRDKVIIEDENDVDDECRHIQFTDSDTDSEFGHDKDLLKPLTGHSVEISKTQSVGQVKNLESEIENVKSKKENPRYMIDDKRRLTSMVEVIKDIEAQFAVICSAGNVLSVMLEASKAHCSSSSNDVTARKMLNPIAFFSSASSRSSSSSKFLVHTPDSKDDNYESSSTFSDDSSMFSGSHQSTLDRLYAWEKKLYDEVRGGERVRVAYMKKCLQLRKQIVKGEASFSVDKTRAKIKDLHTQIKVSMQSVGVISKRIETVRDEELQPQLLELIQGLGKMWKTMAESHQLQKCTLNEVKILLSRTPSKLPNTKSNMHIPPSLNLSHLASNLEAEVRNWQCCFESWINSQRLYVHALTGWLVRCIGLEPNMSKLPFCPPVYGVCIEWLRSLDAVQEDYVIDSLDFFAAGMGSIYTQFSSEDNKSTNGIFDEDITTSAEKMGEIGIKVLCAGMSVAVNSLTEFAMGSAQGYAQLLDQSESFNGIRDISYAQV